MAIGGCHCSGDRFVVCHFPLLIRQWHHRIEIEMRGICSTKLHLCYAPVLKVQSHCAFKFTNYSFKTLSKHMQYYSDCHSTWLPISCEDQYTGSQLIGILPLQLVLIDSLD